MSLVNFVRTGLVAVLLGATSVAAPSFAAEPPRPNVLLILTDDQGWGDLASHGAPHLETPRLDALADEGVRFGRFYVQPVCAPTRAGLLTGRYHLRSGVHGVTRGWETMAASEITLAEALTSAGYDTACFGKWHNGAHYPENPVGQGFQTFLGFCGGHLNNYFDPLLEDETGAQRRQSGYINDVFADAAVEFMRRDRSGPFFCYVAFNTPHSPWQAPDKLFDKYTQCGVDARNACAYAMCESLDGCVGRMLDALDAAGIRDDTIVVYLSDNGPNTDRFNGDMLGRKGSVHEGGVRVPCLLRYPRSVAAGLEIDAIASHIDLAPTIAAWCGAVLPGNVDGVDLAPLLAGEDADYRQRVLFSHWSGGGRVTPSQGAVRTQRWRATLIRDRWSLFDMQADPGQQHDLAEAEPETLERLKRTYAEWFQDATRGGYDRFPVQVGLTESVELPGHEAELHPSRGQGISYVGANGWANDWITGWTDADAYAVWPVDVKQPGRYLAAIDYAANDDQVGAEVEIRLGDAAAAAVIEKPHAGSVMPSPDRYSRGEVYERTWKHMAVGELRLSAAVEELQLRLLRPAIGGGPEIKAVVLTKLAD